MNPKRMRFVIIISIVAATLIFLIYSGIEGTAVYYVTVSELLAQGNKVLDEGIRVNGKVVPGSIDREAESLRLQFTMKDPVNDQTLIVEYTGIVPDTFVDDSDVVVEGQFSQNGIFHATMLLAKCPSKYEPVQPKQA